MLGVLQAEVDRVLGYVAAPFQDDITVVMRGSSDQQRWNWAANQQKASEILIEDISKITPRVKHLVLILALKA